MTLPPDTIIASLDKQVTEFQTLKDLVAEQAHLLQKGEMGSLQASCTKMMQIIEQIDRASAERSLISPHLIEEEIPAEGGGIPLGATRRREEVVLRIETLKKLIGEIEAIRVSIIGKLIEARQVIHEEMNQLTTGAAATKQYYRPKRYREAQYFDRSQ